MGADDAARVQGVRGPGGGGAGALREGVVGQRDVLALDGQRRRHRALDVGGGSADELLQRQPRHPQLAAIHARQGRAAAAARAAAGSASAIRVSASSSCEAERNQASNTLGGSATPASSMAWKNAG